MPTNFKYYTSTIILILMIFALSRGFLVQYQDAFSFFPLHAYADDGGDGGSGGGDAGAGDGGSGGGDAGTGTGDGGEGGSGGGDAGDGTSGGGDAGDGTSGGGDAGEGTPPGGDNGGPNEVIPPPICTIAVSPATVMAGTPATFSWTTTNATSFSVDHGVGELALSGSVTIIPTATATAVGTVTGPGGTATCSVTVTVLPPPPPPVTPAPTCTLAASPSTIPSGQFSALSWTTTNATDFTIDQGVGSVTPVSSGSTVVSTASTRTYTGTVTGPGGTATCSATVTVLPPPPVTPAPTCALTASPGSISSGGSSSLLWTTNNATSFTINQGIGAVTPVVSGSRIVSPSASTIYTGVATGSGGTATCTATVTVDSVPPPPPPPAPTCVLSASPTNVNAGALTMLTWITTNSSTFSINNGIGAVTPVLGGSISSLPINVNTTFIGTVTSPTGQSATCTANVTVNPSAAPSCSLTVSPASMTTGSTATLSWSGSGIATVDIDNGIATATTSPGSIQIRPTAVQSYTYTGTFHATNGQTLTCSATLGVTSAGGGGGGGGGGGAATAPNVSLSALPRVSAQPLAYLYLSQIPYTGLELGPVGTVLYWLALIGLSLALAYLVLFVAVPFINRSFRDFGARVIHVLNTDRLTPVFAGAQQTHAPNPAPEPEEAPAMPLLAKRPPEAPRGYSEFEGFKSFAHKGALSIDDIVKGLSKTEPIYEHVEPIVQTVEVAEPIPSPLQMSVPEASAPASVPADVRGFAIALIQGDRSAVFAGLRQHVQSGGKAERLLSETAFLLDDVYRSRIDGTPCDEDIARLTARFSTSTLEKLVTSLTTAIDSSYSADVTGAKLALTRALSVIGA